jgi:hypothetical protein
LLPHATIFRVTKERWAQIGIDPTPENWTI